MGFRKKQRANNPLANPWVKAGLSPHKKSQLRCWRSPLMVRQPYSEAVWAPRRAVGTSPVPWGERLCKWAQWKFAFILPSAANLLHEKKGLGESGGALFYGKEGRGDFRNNLRVREDWWVFERPFFNGKKLCKWAQWKFTFKLPNAASFIKKEGRVDFRKNLRLREDWWFFEKTLKFKEVLVVFRSFKEVLVVIRSFKKLLLFFRMLRKYL